MVPEPLVIRPSSGWIVGSDLRDLWRFRELILILGGRDLKLRYRQTALGVAWVVLQPLLGAAIFAFVFGRVAGLKSGRVSYFLFALAGMVCWGAFGGALGRASVTLIQNPHLVSKIFFPRLILPLSSLLSVIVDLGVGLLLVGCAMMLDGAVPSWRVVTLPLWLGLLLALGTGFGLMASALTVRYRDVHHVLPVLIQLAFYASPVAYSAQMVPERFRVIVFLNPLAPLLETARWSILGLPAAPEAYLLYSAALSLAVLFGGALFFRSAERGFADVI